MTKFKIGDRVRCIVPNRIHYEESYYETGGVGWKENRIGTIKAITGTIDCPVYWFKEFDNGVYQGWLELLDRKIELRTIKQYGIVIFVNEYYIKRAI